MKLKYLIVFLLVSLMACNGFATFNWIQGGATDSWSDADNWDKDAGAPPSGTPGVPPTTTTEEIKIMTDSWMTVGAHATINTNVGNYVGSGNGVRISVNGSTSLPATLYIVSGGTLQDTAASGTYGLRIGSGSAGGSGDLGYASQTGGTVGLSNLVLGYAGSSAVGRGYYTISAGSLSAATNMRIGAGDNSTTLLTEGQLTIVGNSASISAGTLAVGAYDTTHNGKGTLEFQVGASGVSAIVASTNVLIDRNEASSVANLIVSLSAAPPVGEIVLVNNASANAVVGTFDTVTGDQNGGKALNGDAVKLSFGGTDYYYTLSYVYDAVSHTNGSGNDIALIPEPATLALLSLGLIAIRRRK
jgi:hypothetical protein